MRILRHYRDWVKVKRVKMENNEQVAPAETVSTDSAPATTDAVVQKPQEKVFKQDELNEFVGNALKRGEEKGRREAASELQQQQPQQQAPQAPLQVDPEVIRQMVQQEGLRAAQEAQIHQIANSFIQKLQAGKSSHDDFEEVVAPLEIDKNAILVPYLNDADNTAEMLYELGKNPAKYGSLTVLANVNPKLAKAEFNKLSQSIKKNQEAAATSKQYQASEPLSQVSPSVTSTDNGERSVADMRLDPYNMV
jgi:hypothetical protein